MDFKYYVPDEISALWSKHWQERFSLKSSVLAEKEYHRDWWVKYCVEKKMTAFWESLLHFVGFKDASLWYLLNILLMLIKAIWSGLGTWPNGDLEWHQPLKHMTGDPQNNNTNPKRKSKNPFLGKSHLLWSVTFHVIKQSFPKSRVLLST